ncbi:MAG: AAA-like domain-containing protein [Blastocatellia bacterium]|nr:AAA-like domain-containing protein [Blastocatellia bacterium]
MRTDWQKVKLLFQQALTQEPAQRQAFLLSVCAEDSTLYYEVCQLLLAKSEMDSFLEKPAWAKLNQSGVRDLSSTQPTTPAIELFSAGDIFLGKFEILRLIGQGGMGKVYQARHLSLGTLVAIKVLRPFEESPPQTLERFHREARLAANIVHPNTVRVFDFGTFQTNCYLVMEFLEGETLGERLRRRQSLPLAEVLDFLHQISAALEFIHQKGIIHRDLKPDNVFFQQEPGMVEVVKILDFGIAKPNAFNIFESTFTHPGTIFGSPHYMSPEQCAGEAVDLRSDLYALGAILYEMLSGRRLFAHDEMLGLMYAHVNTLPPALVELVPALPLPVSQVVMKALAKNRAERFATVQELYLAFSAACHPKTNAPVPETQVPTPLPVLPSKAEVLNTLPDDTRLQGKPPSQETLGMMEPVGGGMSLDSRFYIERSTDAEFHQAILRRDSIVLVKGARQMGKTSLLARGLQRARQAGSRVVFIDLQTLLAEQLESPKAVLLAFGQLMEDQLGLEVSPEEIWKPMRSPALNFNWYLKNVVLKAELPPLVWGMDEVDRLFNCPFASEIFGLFRSWHNARAGDPQGPWRRLTQAMAYAVEAHLFLTDLNQSPFNVGTRVMLSDFTFEQVCELNRRYQNPLSATRELEWFFRLVGGHPYLVRMGLHEMVVHQLTLDRFAAQAENDDGPLGDHLKRIVFLLNQDSAMAEAVQTVLKGQTCKDSSLFYRLRSAGVMAGESVETMHPRCLLYQQYLKRHLL